MDKRAQKSIREAIVQMLTLQPRNHSDVKILQQKLFDAKTLLLCLFEAQKRFASLETASVIAFCHELGVVSSQAMRFYEENIAALESVMTDLTESCPVDHLSASDVYQVLLSFELMKSDDGFMLTEGKTQRNATGSYYTPIRLTKKIVQQAFNKYGDYDCGIDTCVDFSCGAGDFLVAAFDYLVDKGADPKKILNSFWAFDVDPCALMVTVLELIARAGLTLSSDSASFLKNQVHLGNPLILSSEPNSSSSEDRIALFANGLLYDKRMGLSKGLLPDGGFSIVIGNPPWEKIRFEERKFFRLLEPSIGRLSSKSGRNSAVESLRHTDQNCVVALYDEITDSYSNAKSLIKNSGLGSLSGELNTCPLFTLLALALASDTGVIALILKSSIFTSPVNSDLFRCFLSTECLDEILFCDNSFGLFPIDRRERFCVALFSRKKNGATVKVSFGNKDLSVNAKPYITVSKEDIQTLNPRTGLLPDLDSAETFGFLLNAYKSLPCFSEMYPDCHYGRLVHLTSHSAYIKTEQDGTCLPVFEGKFLNRHDLRYSTFEGVLSKARYAAKASSRIMSNSEKKLRAPQARYYIEKSFWETLSSNYDQEVMLCWRSLTSATNHRTTLAALSKFVPACQSVQFLQYPDVETLVVLSGLFNSKPFDYFVRKKIPGIDLTQSVISQIPVPPRAIYETEIVFCGQLAQIKQHVINNVISLYRNENELLDILKRQGLTFEMLSQDRETLLDNLDYLFYFSYGFGEEQREYIESTFTASQKAGTER